MSQQQQDSFVEDITLKMLNEDVGGAGSVGFMWNDFCVKADKETSYDKVRGFRYGKDSTEAVLQQQSSDVKKIHGVFRAHQHGDSEMMDCILEYGKNYNCHGIGFCGIILLICFHLKIAVVMKNRCHCNYGKIWYALLMLHQIH